MNGGYKRRERKSATTSSQRVGRVSLSKVRHWASVLPRRFGGLSAPRAYELARYTIAAFFSKDWLWRYVDDQNSPSPYLRANNERGPARIAHELRICMLGEMLFNLQHVEGFDSCAEHLLDGQIESGYAELEIGRILSVHKVPFHFVIPSPGASYDLELKYADGLTACAETKCKLEETEITLATVEDSLKAARRQLPSDRPGIVFVKVPPRWIYGTDFHADLDQLMARYFRSTRRVVNVVMYTSRFLNDAELHLEMMSHRQHINPAHRFDTERGWRILPDDNRLPEHRPVGEWNGFPPHWKRFFHLGERDPVPAQISDAELERRRGLVLEHLHATQRHRMVRATKHSK